MSPEQVRIMLGYSKAENAGSPNFLFAIPRGEVQSVVKILGKFVKDRVIKSFDQQGPPNENCVLIVGCTEEIE